MATELRTVGRSHKNIDFSWFFGRIFSHSELFEIGTVCLMFYWRHGYLIWSCLFLVSVAKSNLQGNCNLYIWKLKVQPILNACHGTYVQFLKKNLILLEDKNHKRIWGTFLHTALHRYSIKLQSKTKSLLYAVQLTILKGKCEFHQIYQYGSIIYTCANIYQTQYVSCTSLRTLHEFI